MSFNEKQIDKTSKPKVAKEDLDHYKFLKTVLDRVAVRIGNDSEDALFTASAKDFNVREVIVSSTNEIEVILPKNLKGVIIKPRKIDRMNISTISAGPKMSYGKGAYFTAFGLNLPDAKSIYIKLESGNNILELIELT